MEISLSQIIVGVAVALILAVIAFGLNVKSSLVRIETLLTGANGDNGLVGDVRQLKEWQRDVDRRHGPDDRRGVA
jgi:hypothetical protein